jgi:hypothetical protein
MDYGILSAQMNDRAAAMMLEAAKPSLLLKKFGGMVEVKADWKHKLWDILRFRKPCAIIHIRDRRKAILPKQGDTVKFRRHPNWYKEAAGGI